MGGIYFTDPFYKRDWWEHSAKEIEDERVYYLSPEGKVAVVADGLVRPNGIVGTPDGKKLYVADINDKKTYSYKINKDASLSNRKLFVETHLIKLHRFGGAVIGQHVVVILKADRDNGITVLDSETQLSGVPVTAWNYTLGNRSAIDWVLDQHKEKKPRDPIIREKFDTYRFADHKERVIDLLKRVVTVSVKTVDIVEAMRTAAR